MTNQAPYLEFWAIQLLRVLVNDKLLNDAVCLERGRTLIVPSSLAHASVVLEPADSLSIERIN